MTVMLRVVLDPSIAPAHADLGWASRALAAALVETAPAGCAAEELTPARRRDLMPGGMIHSPTLWAPLVRHSRETSGDQTAVTLWSLRPWEAPRELPRALVSQARRRLARAAAHADAVIVPTHSMAERLRGHAKLGDRIRVVAGAQPDGFAAPTDADARRRDLALPAAFVAVAAGAGGLATGLRAVAPTGLDVVLLDAPGDVRALAAAAGIDAARVHAPVALDRGDRAAVLDAAAAFVAPSPHAMWPWRAVEAMALGTPVVAVDSAVHREVVLDGGHVVPEPQLAGALAEALGDGGGAVRLRALGLDRARAFSWASAAERVWQVHADL